MANPGRRPFEVASPGTGVLTEVDSTQAMHRSLAVPCRTTAPLTRSAARNTDSNALRHCSSVVPSTDPAGGPPTLINAPSSRPKASSARAQAARRCGRRSGPPPAGRPVQYQPVHRFGQRLGSSGDEDHARPSATSCSGRLRVAEAPVLAAVTRNTRSAKVKDP